MKKKTRRAFLRTSVLGGSGLVGVPLILRRSLFAGTIPANQRIQVAQIGCGRMGREDMAGVMSHPLARLVAVCDLDARRLASARDKAVAFYRQQGEAAVDVKAFKDYREVLARPDVDAVIVSPPDHWHALIAIEAAVAGKHIYVQKPITYAIAEAIALRTAARARKIILQTGSQQRSETPWNSFRVASEAVRNGRIGQLAAIRIGVGIDRPKGKPPVPGPTPASLDFERWLGPAPEQTYMEDRVHPQEGFGRPGWITTEDFGLGMITNWGAHHLDIAQWAMGMELSGPTTIEARAEFMKNDVWTVHETYHAEMLYPNGVRVILDSSFENGLRFEGSEGWVFCARGPARVTASDPLPPEPDPSRASLRASAPRVLAPLGEGATRWPASPDHYLNWLESIVAKRDPIAPVDQAVRSLEACCLAWIGMKLARKLTWDPAREAFVGNDEANRLRGRRPRKAEYDFNSVMSKAGLAGAAITAAGRPRTVRGAGRRCGAAP